MEEKETVTADELLRLVDVLNNNGILLGEEAEQYRRRIELLKGDTHGK